MSVSRKSPDKSRKKDPTNALCVGRNWKKPSDPGQGRADQKVYPGQGNYANFLNYNIFIDVDEEEQDLTAGVLYKNNSLFFMVDLQIECPDDMEIQANYRRNFLRPLRREEPFYGRILVSEGSTYYQLCHILGPSRILDTTMVSYLSTWSRKKYWKLLTSAFLRSTCHRKLTVHPVTYCPNETICTLKHSN